MTAIDCESRESTLHSLAAIYEVEEEKKIDDFLRSLDIDRHYAENHPPCTADKEVLRLFEQAFNGPRVLPTKIYWFHLTRVLPSANFEDGIKPLSEALDGVWGTILSVFNETSHEEGLKALRSRGTGDDRYGVKLSSQVHGGPFAMLVRESAFRSEEMWSHDYLSLPEIMNDICDAYHHAYKVRIDEQLRAALVPCVVKFWSNKQISGTIPAAMYYLYCTAHGRGLTIDANTCYDGGNEWVPPEQLVGIEFLTL